jgi:hypothetical protein
MTARTAQIVHAELMEADRQRGAIVRAYENRHGETPQSYDRARRTPLYLEADARYMALSAEDNALDDGRHERTDNRRLARRMFGGGR